MTALKFYTALAILGFAIYYIRRWIVNTKKYGANNLISIIKDYQQTADIVVNIFKEKYNVSNLLEGYHSGMYSQTGKLEEFGIKFYAFHGIGLTAHFEDKTIDFDFAFFPEQRHGGFDLNRLYGFIESQPEKYNRYLDKKILEKDFNELIEQRIIHIPELKNSTFLYFLTEKK